jgi:hypothetical protein
MICYPVAAGEPRAKSYVSACDECGCAVWRAYSNPDTDAVFCVDCAAKEIEAAEKRGDKIEWAEATKEQIEEFERWIKDFGAD